LVVKIYISSKASKEQGGFGGKKFLPQYKKWRSVPHSLRPFLKLQRRVAEGKQEVEKKFTFRKGRYRSEGVRTSLILIENPIGKKEGNGRGRFMLKKKKKKTKKERKKKKKKS